jgi:hypothetical protein
MRQGSTSILSRRAGAGDSDPGAAARNEAPSRAARFRNRVAWLCVIALFLAQFGLWRQFALREVVWAYPPYFDQLAYLEQSYQTYERILDHGLIRGLEEGMGLKFGHLPLNAAGATLHLQAAVLYLMTGPSRLSAISLNFIYWTAFQLVLVATLRWLTGRWSAVFLGLGLLFATITPFYFAGGLFDFRLDFIAFCLFGVFICLVIRSSVFEDWRWSAVAGFAAAVMGTSRFITLVYLLGIFILFAVFLVVQWVARWRDLPGQQTVQRRIRGLVTAGLVIALFAGPVLWHHREAIRSYYVAGHVTGDEKKLRAEESGTTSLVATLKFYPISVMRDHAGYDFLKLSALVLVVAFVAGAVGRDRAGKSSAAADRWAAIVFVVLCLIIPGLILTNDTAKSPIVGGIMVAPLVWLVILVALDGFRAIGRGGMTRWSRGGLMVTATGVMLFGIAAQFSQYSRRTVLGTYRPEVEKLDAMYDRMARECQLLGWTSPAVAIDGNIDYLYHKILTILAYERDGILLNTGEALGRLQRYDAKELYDRLALSDFAMITKNTGATPPFEYPFDHQMEEWHGDVMKWCRQNMVELEYDELGMPFDREITLFIRPAAGMHAEADGWITSAGLDVTALAAALRQFPIIEVRGQADFSLLPRTPRVTATLSLPRGREAPLPATFDRAGSNYTITIATALAEMPESGTVHVHLNFDTHFVPKELGANADTRELVMKIPERASLHRAPAATQP